MRAFRAEANASDMAKKALRINLKFLNLKETI